MRSRFELLLVQCEGKYTHAGKEANWSYILKKYNFWSRRKAYAESFLISVKVRSSEQNLPQKYLKTILTESCSRKEAFTIKRTFYKNMKGI